jgi:ABC-type transport system involved in multi-copper enzyme maturation permease subunit
MHNALTIAWATYQDTVRRPLYYILIGVFVVLVYISHFLTLFTFNQEANMVREMGVASLALWGFLVFAILTPVVVTQELEDRTAVTLLAKPLTRSAFLVGKYLGLLAAVLLGLIVLGGVLFFTLWWMTRGDFMGAEPELAFQLLAAGLAMVGAGGVIQVRSLRLDPDSRAAAWSRRAAFFLYSFGVAALISAAVFSTGDRDRADAAWQMKDLKAITPMKFVWEFLRANGVIVVEGLLLSFLQVALLGAICVSLAAFVPAVVSVAGTALVFILGNLSNYLLAGIETSGSAAVRAAGRGLTYLVPNLGYFNLQTHFSEGSIISPGYLALALLHASLYTTIVFLVSCALFERREIR